MRQNSDQCEERSKLLGPNEPFALHAGPGRIGDNTEPEAALRWLGRPSADGDADERNHRTAIEFLAPDSVKAKSG
jgi:hypothetical protein